MTISDFKALVNSVLADSQGSPALAKAITVATKADGTVWVYCNGSGVAFPPDFSPRLAAVASAMAELFEEYLAAHGQSNWPRCPLHPDTHPLDARDDSGISLWVCPTSGAAVAEIGHLTD